MNPFDYFNDPFLMHLNSDEKQAIVERLRVWGQMTQPFCERLDNWFCNFDEVDDKRLAVKVFHNFKFYTPDYFTNRLKQLYDSVERHLSATNNNPSDIVLVIPDGHGDSADRHAYDLIKHWNLLRGQIYTVSELAQKTFTDPVFILFNDTHGTGNQFLRDIWPILSQYGEHKIFVLAIAIAEEALINFRKEMPRVHVIPAIPVMSAKTIFTGAEYLRLQEIGQRVYPKHPMGYGDAGILTAYYFQCPNNTLPIVWADGKNNEVSGKAYRWNPLFPYIPKKKTETTKPPSYPPSISKKGKSRTPDNAIKTGAQSPSAVLTYRYRVAILDLDLGLTNLSAFALALNGCQGFFHFSFHSLSNRELVAKAVINITGQKNLSVYQINHEFFDEFDELAVDVVGCFTKFPLAFVDKANGSVSYNYFSGPSDVDGRFMFISANQLQQFTKAAERSFEEGLAYILLSQLVVHFTDIRYHRNTANCPMDFCEIRSNIIGGLRKKEFCRTCTGQIKDDELLSAFEGILHLSPIDMFITDNEGGNTELSNARANKESDSTTKRFTPMHTDLPNKSYARLWGREHEVETIMSVLRDPEGKRLVSISGLGGIGKTALAREIANKCRQETLYNEIIWVTAKEEVFIGGEIYPLVSATFSFEVLLNSIATHLGLTEIVDMKHIDVKIKVVRGLLESVPCLIVVDNLETVENYKALVVDLGMLTTNISKFLFTSRPQLTDIDEIYCISLEGLHENDAVSFLRYDAKKRGIASIAEAKDTALRRIYQTTGGAPLAMKLVMGQISRLPLEVVLQNLQEVKGGMDVLYIFIYRTIWKLLSPHARKVLIAMPTFPSSAIRSAIERVSTVKGNDLTAALVELVIMSLLDVSHQLSDSKKRYSIHPLTRNFLNTELANRWM